MNNPYVGEMIMFAGNFAPRGWAFCNGQILPINQNTALFSLLGTIYGGDGRTTFALPDMRGRAPVHAGRGPGLGTYSEGEKGGRETYHLSTAQIPQHNHSISGSANSADQKSAAGGFLPSNGRSDPDNLYAGAIGTAAVMGNGSVGDTGNSTPIDNMQPFATVNYIIALVGVYPSRS